MPLGYCPVCKVMTEIKIISVQWYGSHEPLVVCKKCGTIRLEIKAEEEK